MCEMQTAQIIVVDIFRDQKLTERKQEKKPNELRLYWEVILVILTNNYTRRGDATLIVTAVFCAVGGGAVSGTAAADVDQ